MGMIDNLEKMLASGQDSALLRYGLGTAYQKEGRIDKAIEHLSSAVQQDPQYSAAWKAYGKALVAAGRNDAAAESYRNGIQVAEGQGDIQAAREMKVFLKRLAKDTPK